MKRGTIVTIFGLIAAAGFAGDAAYLGVATAPLDPMTGRHLGLGEGVGLAVMHLDEKGVLTDTMEEGDILHKFNDQILVSPEQLAILVRREKPGAKAALTVIRSGKAETIEVKLGSVDRSRLPPIGPSPDAGPRMEWRRRMSDMRDWIENFQRQMRQWHPDAFDAGEDPGASPSPAPDVQVKRSSTIAETRDGTTITLTDRDGDRRAKIEREGEVVFDGPVNTDRDLKKLPEEYRGRIDELSDGFEGRQPKAPPARRGPKQIL